MARPLLQVVYLAECLCLVVLRPAMVLPVHSSPPQSSWHIYGGLFT